MLLMFSKPVLIRHLWQLKTVDLIHWCIIHAVLLATKSIVLTNNKVFLKIAERFKQFKHFYDCIVFKLYVYLFNTALCKLIFVLHQDMLFHSQFLLRESLKIS